MAENTLPQTNASKQGARDAACKAISINDGGASRPECEWPLCDCDPHAVKVVSALDEMGGRAAAPAAPISGDFEQVLREMEGVAMEEDAASEFDDKQLDLIANWHDRLLASRVIATNKPTVAKANRAWVGSSAESTADGLCRELAAVLDENWIFLAVHAQSYAAGSGHPMALVHAEMLARVHAVMTKAHAAGYVPKANTTRLPVILAEHGYDAAALVSDGAKSSANNPVAPHQHIFP